MHRTGQVQMCDHEYIPENGDLASERQKLLLKEAMMESIIVVAHVVKSEIDVLTDVSNMNLLG